MDRNTEITEQDKALMVQFDITSETKTQFYYEGYKYDKLKDAVEFARRSVEKKQATNDA